MRIVDTYLLPLMVFLALAAVTTFDFAFSKVSIWQDCDSARQVTRITSGGCS
jgi:hypothetical protein